MAEDLGTDYVDAVATLPRTRGFRGSRSAQRQHEFLTPALPTPALVRPSTWPATERTAQQVLCEVKVLDPGAGRKEQQRRRAGVELLLGWLAGFEGDNWQQRWLASKADDAGSAWTDLCPSSGLSGADGRGRLTGAIGRLILLDAIRPSYGWLYQVRSGAFFGQFRDWRDPSGFAALDPFCDANPRFTSGDRRGAYVQLARILIHNGGQLADITLTDCVEAYRAQTGYSSRSHSHWYLLLRQVGIISPESPPTIHAASRRGQLTVEELVDGYEIANRDIRDLFVAYLHERAPAIDYTTLRQLASKLILVFWRDLELHHPGIESLHLPDEVARAWKQRLAHVRYGNRRIGQRREDPHVILMTVRAFYADLTHWALEDPARWARWAVPSPVTSRDIAGMSKDRARAISRMHQRIRELTPLLPSLVAAAEQQKTRAADLLAAAGAVAPGEPFQAHGQQLRRTELITDPTRGGGGRPGLIYAVSEDGVGPRRNLTLEEQSAFWTWAVVEVLRHTGLRIEEMLELTHRSFVAYTLPTTGEVVPLLQVTPSKTDKERLLVVSPELAEVLTAIIAKVREGQEHVPLVSRYDQAERLHSPELPFLFQRPWGLRRQGMTHMRVKELLDRLVETAGITAVDGSPIRFTPHDFRRIFVTEAVASGLPVHIAAKLLGHQSISTTQTYIAVYDQDVIDHHRAFIARRRALRPSEEYRQPTEAEWDEFLGHFEKRKVELGVCGRAFGTPCQHEHACVRCPVLRPDPAQHHRLQEIITNLHDRLTEARQRGWHGEVDGLEATIAAAQQKLEHMRRIATTTTGSVNLGLPTTRPQTSSKSKT
jgi:integrase